MLVGHFLFEHDLSENRYPLFRIMLLVRRRMSLSPGNEKSRKLLSRRDLVLKPD